MIGNTTALGDGVMDNAVSLHHMDINGNAQYIRTIPLKQGETIWYKYYIIGDGTGSIVGKEVIPSINYTYTANKFSFVQSDVFKNGE